jgi:asparagine synthetase B (glutamine-hydrolysing)
VTGVFGLYDPAGVDRAHVETAAAMPFRGDVRIWTDGPVAMGCYGDGALHHSVLDVRADAVVVGDGRWFEDGGRPWAVPPRTDRLDTLLGRYAVGRWDLARRELTLARDPFGERPLLFAHNARRFGFASDPDVLRRFGLAADDLDDEETAHWLATGFTTPGRRTAFRGVARVHGGTVVRWRAATPEAAEVVERFFRPEELPSGRVGIREAAEELEVLLPKVVADHFSGTRPAVLLSAGRDSASVAVAMARAGLHPVCVTNECAPPQTSEAPAARLVADALGFEHRVVRLPVGPVDGDLTRHGGLLGTPFAYPRLSQDLAIRRGLEEAGADAIVTGDGGEPFFCTTPVAVPDLLRHGRPVLAARTAVGFSRHWKYSIGSIVKLLARAVAPDALLRSRERSRPHPPWVVRPPAPVEVDEPRTVRAALLRGLTSWGAWGDVEVVDRLFGSAGAYRAAPLFDLRIVKLALRLDTSAVVPVPGPKPVLAASFLGPFETTRAKVTYRDLHTRYAHDLLVRYPELVGPGTFAAREGLVDPSKMTQDALGRWVGALPALATLESWLTGRSGGFGEERQPAR